jgi:hypothetical protein
MMDAVFARAQGLAAADPVNVPRRTEP